MNREQQLREIQQREDLTPAWGGVSLEEKDAVFSDFLLTGKPRFEKLEGASLVAASVLNALRSVYGRDWLVAWHMQYGIINAVEHAQHVLWVLALPEAQVRIQATLDELTAAQPYVQDVYRVGVMGNDSDCRTQDGIAMTGGELYVYGARLSLAYVLKLLEDVVNDRFITQPSTRQQIPETLMMLGGFANEQIHFVENVLPRLQDIFEDRPSSIKVPRRPEEVQVTV